MGLTPDIESAFDVAFTAAKKAVWAKDPVEQVAVNLIILVAAMLSSSVGFAPGIVIAMLAIIFIFVAIARILIGLVLGLR